ncbi:MAG: hypothetical protein CM15mP32_4800 [Flavobacteriaceae bacterium]|nr:MAG: hypothetical protein CM15mP32_4800 [Flavobacteriaceae bacterium]
MMLLIGIFIYPDGVAAKAEQLWTSGDRIHEWQESMAIFGPNQHPHNLIERILHSLWFG